MGYLDAIPDLRDFWLQIRTPETFISASDLAQNDCSNTVWRWGNNSGQNKAFDQAILSFVFYIMASYKYVKSVSQGTYTL